MNNMHECIILYICIFLKLAFSIIIKIKNNAGDARASEYHILNTMAHLENKTQMR